MNTEYYWWDLEESHFKGLLYDSMGMYFLGNYAYKSWDEFVENDPHMSYAYLIDGRFNTLEQQFVDLRVIPQMLGVENLPLESTVQNINRYDWLKSIVDLALFRFSSIRDILFHFVNEVLELEISDHRLNLKNLKKQLRDTHPVIVEGLKKVDSSGSSLRNNRNTRAHKGFTNLFTDDDQLFKSMSWCEDGGGKSENYDLLAVYNGSREKIYENIVTEVKQVLAITIEIVDELYTTYRDNFEVRAECSSQGLKWSQHFQLHQKKS